MPDLFNEKWIEKAPLDKLKAKLTELRIPFNKDELVWDLKLKLLKHLIANAPQEPGILPSLPNLQPRDVRPSGSSAAEGYDLTMEGGIRTAPEEQGLDVSEEEEDAEFVESNSIKSLVVQNLTSDIDFQERPFSRAKILSYKRTYKSFEGIPSRPLVVANKSIEISARTSAMDKKLQGVQHSLYLSLRPLLLLFDTYSPEVGTPEYRVWKHTLEAVANVNATINVLRRDEVMYKRGAPTRKDPDTLDLISESYLADMKKEKDTNKILASNKRAAESSFSGGKSKKFKSNYGGGGKSFSNSGRFKKGNFQPAGAGSSSASSFSFSRPNTFRPSSNYRGSNPSSTFVRKDNRS